MKTKDADEGKHTTLLFSGVTELVVKKKVEFGKRSAINPDGAGCVKIYTEDDVKVKESSTVRASIDAQFNNLDVEDAEPNAPTLLIGQFIAKKSGQQEIRRVGMAALPLWGGCAKQCPIAWRRPIGPDGQHRRW